MKVTTILETATSQVILLDGGMGTMLIERGLLPGELPELWNLERPEHVRDVHKEYLEAGASAILTNTFGASSIKLADSGLADKTAEINRAAAEIARSARPQASFVIGDLGPCGKILEPYGDLKEKDLRDSLEQQISALIEGGVDALILETQMDLRELVVGVAIAKNLSSLPVIASFTFNKTKRGFFTLMGNSVQAAIDGATNAGADIVGTNCSLDSSEMKDLLSEMGRLTSLPIYAKPNAGRAELCDGKASYAQSVAEFAKSMPEFLRHGVRLLGGCCGTNPAYIKTLHQMLEGQGAFFNSAQATI